MSRLDEPPAADGALNASDGTGIAGRPDNPFQTPSGAAGGPSGDAAGQGAGGRRPVIRLSIYVLVLALSLALVAPAIGFLTYVIGQQNDALRRQAAERGTQLANEVGERLEQELESLGTMLAVFASSGWLEADELALMHRRATRALAGTGRHLLVLDENLEQMLNTRVPFGTPLGKTGNPDIAREVLETGKPAVSDVFIGRVADAPVFNALRPVTLPDGRERVLILTRNAATLGRLLSTPEDHDPWNFVVMDGSGQVVTRRVASEPDGIAVPPSCQRDASGPQPPGSDRGSPQVFIRLVEGSRWRVCAWRTDQPAGARWTALFTAAAAWIVVAVATAIMLSALISRSIARTARIGSRLGSGAEVPYVPTVIAEVDDVRRTLAEAGAERVRNERRLELLLREAAHRARNQIALTISLVDLSARSAGTAAELKKDLSSRLMALGRSVDALTDKAPDTARLGSLITAQLAMFVDDRGERLATEGDEVLISERAAQSLSLVLHELATNASKYGGWSRPDGSVTVRWHLTADSLIVEWAETGAPGEAPERSGFGTRLMDALVETGLRGKLERSFGATGFTCRLVLPRTHIAPQQTCA